MKSFKWLKLTGGAVAVFLLALLVGGLFLPQTKIVQRSIAIRSDVHLVFNELKDYQNWFQWRPWTEKEPTASYFYEGSPGEVGFTMGWSGEVIGEGSLTLLEVQEPSRIEGKLEFRKPQWLTAKDIWELTESDGVTTVKWSNEASLDYPLGRWLGLYLDSLVGPDYERGLERLKNYLEGLNPNIAPTTGHQNTKNQKVIEQ